MQSSQRGQNKALGTIPVHNIGKRAEGEECNTTIIVKLNGIKTIVILDSGVSVATQQNQHGLIANGL